MPLDEMNREIDAALKNSPLTAWERAQAEAEVEGQETPPSTDS